MDNWYRKLLKTIKESEETKLPEDFKVYRPRVGVPSLETSDTWILSLQNPDDAIEMDDISSYLREIADSLDAGRRRGGFVKNAAGRTRITWGIKPK